MAELPGEPLLSGFTYHRGAVPLPRAALERVFAKMEAVRIARLGAMADSRNATVGAAAPGEEA